MKRKYEDENKGYESGSDKTIPLEKNGSNYKVMKLLDLTGDEVVESEIKEELPTIDLVSEDEDEVAKPALPTADLATREEQGKKFGLFIKFLNKKVDQMRPALLKGLKLNQEEVRDVNKIKHNINNILEKIRNKLINKYNTYTGNKEDLEKVALDKLSIEKLISSYHKKYDLKQQNEMLVSQKKADFSQSSTTNSKHGAHSSSSMNYMPNQLEKFKLFLDEKIKQIRPDFLNELNLNPERMGAANKINQQINAILESVKIKLIGQYNSHLRDKVDLEKIAVDELSIKKLVSLYHDKYDFKQRGEILASEEIDISDPNFWGKVFESYVDSANKQATTSSSSSSSNVQHQSNKLANDGFSNGNEKKDSLKIKEQKDDQKNENRIELNLKASELNGELPEFIKKLFKYVDIIIQELIDVDEFYNTLKVELEKFDWSKWLVNDKKESFMADSVKEIEDAEKEKKIEAKGNEGDHTFKYVCEKSFDLLEYFQASISQGFSLPSQSGIDPVFIGDLNKYLPKETAEYLDN